MPLRARDLINGTSLSALKDEFYVNLASRAVIIPAVTLSYLIVREREQEPQPRVESNP
jgi:hypothetical protein